MVTQIKKDCKNSLLKAQRTPSGEFTGEYGVLHHLINNGLLPFSGAFFDIGANIGDWTEHLLQLKNDLEVHVFEPVPHNFSKLIDNLSEPIKRGQIHPNNCAMCQEDGFKSFYYYETQPRWSTFYRRDLQVEKEYNLSPPRTFSVYSTTLDEYCHRLNLKRISFIKIDVEGAELDVFRGANKLLEHDRIDYIQFEYGGTYIDAGITLQQIFDYLHNFDFMIFKILENGLKYQPQFLPELEDFNYANFLAVNARLRSQLLSEPPKMLDLGQLCKKHSIIPRGIIHIGAHEGKETEKYLEMGAEKVLFVEANPTVFERLKKNTSRFPEVQTVNCAISDHSGSTTLHVTSMDESSSLLPLKHHKNYYPDIRESQDITVTSKTLDGLLEELSLSKDDYNILNIDIQGAELLAFKGASNTLRHIECINSEVNYEELYEGCAIIDQVDAFLEGYGFKRTKTTTPYHHSWGDAFYVKKPVVTMATLGNPRYGRFANQLFQYAFLKIYAKKHDMHVETAEWIGKALFGADDPPVSKKLPLVRQETYKLAEDHIPNAKVPYKNVDFGGIFQYHTSFYAPYKEYFRSLFKPVSLIEDYLVNGYNKLKAMGNTIICLHLRRGDYGYSHYFVAPTSWYLKWLNGYWETLDKPVLFIASDEPEKVLGDFEKFAPVTCKDLGIQINGIELYPDFYILSHCDILAISNSSFSFAAAMMNENANVFFRPHLPSQKLIPFDPWHSETIFRDAKEEDYSEKKHTSEAACRKDQNETGSLSETTHEMVMNSVKAANGTDAITAPELSHTSALHHNEQGTLCFNAGNMEEARTHFKKAARLQPNNYDFLRNLADFYYVKDRSIENALEIYQKILECYPDNVETLQITGNICVALERFNEAQAYYSRLLKIEPWNSKIQDKLDALRTSSIETPSISEIQP